MLSEMFNSIMKEVLLWLQLCEWKYETMEYKEIVNIWGENL